MRAEQAGFTAAMCSDHFCPWSERQGQSGFAWSWLGAALQATGLPFGVVNAPGQRYHPAIIAQAIGTLAAMYPGRFWVALGTGEASNEHITGDGWPRKERAQRPAARVRRRDPRTARRARRSATTAWSPSTGPGCGRCPETPPPLIGAAVSVETAGWVRRLGRRAGHRSAAAHDQLRQMVDAYRSAGGRGPLCCRSTSLCAPTRSEALADRPRPVADQRLRARRSAGTSTRPRPSTRGRARAAGSDARSGARLRRPGPARRAAGRARRARLRRDLPAPRRPGAGAVHRRVRREGAAAARRDAKGRG